MKVKVRANKTLFTIGIVLLVLRTALLTPGASATTPIPTQCSQAAGGATQTGSVSFFNYVSSVTVFTAVSNCNAIGELFILTVWYVIATSGAAPIPALTLSDNNSDGYTQDVAMQMLRCAGTSNSGGNCPGYTYADQITTFNTGFVASAGHILITIASNANFPYNGKFYASWQFWSNPTSTSSVSTCTGIGTYDNAGTASVQPQGGLQTSCTVQAPPSSITYGFQLYTQNVNNNAAYQQVGGFLFNVNQQQTFSTASTTNCTVGGPASGQCLQYGAGIANGPVSSSPAFGITCSSACSAVSTAFLAVSFGSNSQGAIIASDWNPASTASTSGQGYLASNSLYYYTDQNGQSSAGNVVNFTSKEIATHCTKIYCYLFVAVYLATTPNAVPSSGNPFKVQNPVYLIAIGNGSTTAATLSLPMAVNIPSGNYWAIGICSNSTASRGSGATGTGVELSGINWASQASKFAIPGTTGQPPQTMFGSVLSGANQFYFKAQMAFQVTTTTTTQTSTVTYGTATTTVTSTSTTTTNAITPANPGYWYIPMVYIGVFFGLFAVVGADLVRRR